MIDLHYWPTPNGKKISIFLEETGLPYKIVPVNIGKGEQFEPSFLAISPNNRMPAIVDHEPADGGAPISVFESGAILLYLADKTGKLLPKDARGRARVTQWVMWQMGGLGPMMGQAGHFMHYAAGKSEYATDRYKREVGRLLGVIDKELSTRDYLAGDYSIADIASYPWASTYERAGYTADEFPHVVRWLQRIADRPAVKRGMAVGDELRTSNEMTEEQKKLLFSRDAKTVKR